MFLTATQIVSPESPAGSTEEKSLHGGLHLESQVNPHPKTRVWLAPFAPCGLNDPSCWLPWQCGRQALAGMHIHVH